MKKAQTLVLLILVVFLAGCLTQPKGGVTGTNGVIIKSFSPDLSEIRSGEFVPLTLTVENVGESTATGIVAELFGLDIGSQNLQWNLQSGSNPQTWTSLMGINPAINVLTGEQIDFSWGLKAPTTKVDNTYTADTRVLYKYSTSASATLKFITYDYLKSLPVEQQESIKKTSGIISTKTSGGPIGISFSVGNRPLILYQSGDNKFSLQIVITNVGGGGTFKPDAVYSAGSSALSAQDYNKLKVSVSKGGIKDITCSPATSGTIDLSRGKSRTLFCTVTADKSAVGNTKDYAVDVTLEYGYFVDSSTIVKVLKGEAEITPPGVTVCSDTDKGDKPTVKGTCSDETGKVLEDQCEVSGSPGYVNERFCENNRCVSRTAISCKDVCITGTSRCEDGRCICENLVNVQFNIDPEDKLKTRVTVLLDEQRSVPFDYVAITAKDYALQISPKRIEIAKDEIYEYKKLKCVEVPSATVVFETGTPPSLTPLLSLSNRAGQDIACTLTYSI